MMGARDKLNRRQHLAFECHGLGRGINRVELSIH